jgi:hypothetical protein
VGPGKVREILESGLESESELDREFQ